MEEIKTQRQTARQTDRDRRRAKQTDRDAQTCKLL